MRLRLKVPTGLLVLLIMRLAVSSAHVTISMTVALLRSFLVIAIIGSDKISSKCDYFIIEPSNFDKVVQ